jgi:hypothetical protein
MWSRFGLTYLIWEVAGNNGCVYGMASYDFLVGAGLGIGYRDNDGHVSEFALYATYNIVYNKSPPAVD